MIKAVDRSTCKDVCASSNQDSEGSQFKFKFWSKFEKAGRWKGATTPLKCSQAR